MAGLSRRALALGIAAALAVAGASGAEEPSLEELRSAILESRERVGAHEREERSLLEQLEESDRLSDVLRRQVERAREAAAVAHENAERFEEERVAAGERLDRTRAAMSKRVIALYKAGDVGPVRFLFASSSMPELLTRASALETLVRFDADLVDRHRRDLESFERLESESRRAAEERDATASLLAKHSAELESERRLRRRLLRGVREDRTQERALLVELEKAARALEATVEALGEESAAGDLPPTATGFADRKGRLASPLAARIKLPFGRVVDEEFRTETFRKGVEFEARGGESVRAVAPGAVRFAGWFRGYGRLVIVDHGDAWYSVMGHLADIFVEVGAAVTEGDTVGAVGDTGSLAGPSLYFELRAGSEPVDPEEWLVPGYAVATER